MEFKDNLRRLRKKNKLSQAELAEKAGVSRDAITRYESGKLKNPSSAVVIRLAEVLHCTYQDLIEYTIVDLGKVDGVPTSYVNPPEGMPGHIEFGKGSNMTLGKENIEAENRLVENIRKHHPEMIPEGVAPVSPLDRFAASFGKLNETGQAEAVKRLDELTRLDEYKK